MEHTTCPVCKGSGKYPDCQGKGYKFRTIDVLGRTPHKAMLTGRAYEKKKQTCRTCQGDGLCTECHGTGFVDDPEQEIFKQIHKKVEQYIDKGNKDEAEKLLNESLAEHGKEPNLLYDLGQLISLRGHELLARNEKSEANQLFEKSIGIFNDVLAVDPNCKEAYLNLCLIFQHADKYEEAIEIGEKGLKLFPKYYELAVLFCMSLNKLAQWKKVLQIATTKLEEVKNDTEPELDYEILDENGQKEGTVRDENKGAFLVCMGDASFGKGEFNKAIEFYEMGREIPYWNTEFVDQKLKEARKKG